VIPFDVVPLSSIQPAEWRATYILKPDLRQLTASIRDLGWVAPLVVRREDQTIIDGFSRWLVAQKDKTVMVRDQQMVPVSWMEVDEVDAMIAHVRLNRARGSLVAKPLSNIIRDILARGYDESILQKMLGLSTDEFDLMAEGSLIKTRKLAEHTYSDAWVPVEAPPVGAVVAPRLQIERPPNQDR
jgi:ParB-like chromosome segregation protein Spo0J